MGAVEYLQACARQPDALEALGPRDDDRADDPAADGPARGFDRRLSSPRIAATTGSTATFCGPSRRPTANGARNRARPCRDDRALARPDPDRAGRGACPSYARSSSPKKARSRVSAGQAKAEPHYELHAGRLATLIGELLHIQNGARLAARHRRRAARRPGLRRSLHSRQAQRRGRRLRRPDRLDPAPARPAGDGRLGALQARPAGRSCAGRRGPGHQCRAVGDHRAPGRGIFQRLERSRERATAPCSWSAISSSRSTASRAPTRSEFDEARRKFARSRGLAQRRRRSVQLPAAVARVSRPVDRRELPLGASRSSMWSMRSSPTLGHQALALAEPPPPHRAHHRDRPGRSSCGTRSRSKMRTTRR